MSESIITRFWNAPDEAFFTRDELAAIRRCSISKIEREAWEHTGIAFRKDGNRTLYKKRDILAYLNTTCVTASPAMQIQGGNHAN